MFKLRLTKVTNVKLELPDLVDPNEILSSAVKNYCSSGSEQKIHVWLNEEKESPYLASYFVRDWNQMPELEKKAIDLCYGRVLDIAAGAGPHSKILLEKGLEVDTLEFNPGFCELLNEDMRLNVIEADFFNWESSDKYDTLLLLMNGFGISGNNQRLELMLQKLTNLLLPNGQILVEITDYSFSEDFDHELNSNPQVKFRLMYNNSFSSEFNWFYPNLGLIEKLSSQFELSTEVILQLEESVLLKLQKQ